MESEDENMIRYAKESDGEKIAELVLIILKDMDLPFVVEYGEELTVEMLQEAATIPTYRYGYQRGLVNEIDGEVAGIAFGYSDLEEPTIDAPLRDLLPKYGLPANLQLFEDPETFPEEWYLDSIAVADSFRGKGVGSQLLRALPQMAQASGRSRIGLSVDKENPLAKKLYTRHGFVTVGQAKISGHLYDHMQKEI